MRVFYVRCSTVEQNDARQLKMAEEQNAEKVFVDKASGKNTDRAAFKEMMVFVREGDIVVVESISRIARNTRDLLSIVSELTEKGVEFVSLKENIDTTTPHGRFMLTVFGALAELERENILERTEKMIFHQAFHDWTKKEEKDFSLSSQLVQIASQSLAA